MVLDQGASSDAGSVLAGGLARRSPLLVKIKAFLAWSVLTSNSAHSFLEIPCPTSK